MLVMKPNSKRLINALGRTVLVIALLHIALLVIYAFATGNFVYLNLANILDLQLFFPQIEYSLTVGLIGLIPLAILIWWNYKKV